MTFQRSADLPDASFFAASPSYYCTVVRATCGAATMVLCKTFRAVSDNKTCESKRRLTHRQKEHAVHPERRVAGVEGQPGRGEARARRAPSMCVRDVINKGDKAIFRCFSKGN